MDLKKFLPGKGGKQSKEYFWTLVIEPGWVQAGIWKIQEGKAKVVFSGLPTAWELDEELINAIDTALSSTIQSFPEDSKEPEKTVFGVIASWVSGGEIKKEYLGKIKKICSELSLSPVGFVVLPEAMAHLMKSEEGAPLNAVVLGVYREALEISLFNLGNLVGSTKVARSVSVVDDVNEGLTRFAGNDTLPSRIILYDGKEGELEEVRQALLKVNWGDFEKIKFLHAPKIEVVDSRKKVHAVSLAGASELAGISILEEKKKSEDGAKLVEKELPDEISQAEETSPEELGFVLEKDIVSEDQELDQTQDKDLSQKELGRSIDNIRKVSDKDVVKVPSRIKSGYLSNIFTKVKEKISSTKNKLVGIGRLGSTGKKTFVIGTVLLIVLLLSGFIFWWYYPKASVTIYVSPQDLKEKVELVVDLDADVSDFSELTLVGELLETDIEGEKTTPTSGTKTMGEKAKGKVTIYRVGSDLTLSLGTVVNGPNNLKFTLDSQVVVASGSASSPGSTEAEVTAEDIGSEYNLAEGTSFTVANYSVSDLEAKNNSSFSGGTSYEIRIVSEDDQEDLRKDLEEELLERVKNELMSGLSENKLFVDDSLVGTTSSDTFSDKVGDEASSLKLTLKLNATALTIEKAELIKFSQDILASRVPEGFVLRDEQIDVDFKLEEIDDKLYKLEATIEANLLPNIDTEDVVKKIKGRYPNLAEDFLTKEIPGFVRAEIKLKPNFPGRLKTLPRVEKNIEVIISAEK